MFTAVLASHVFTVWCGMASIVAKEIVRFDLEGFGAFIKLSTMLRVNAMRYTLRILQVPQPNNA